MRTFDNQTLERQSHASEHDASNNAVQASGTPTYIPSTSMVTECYNKE